MVNDSYSYNSGRNLIASFQHGNQQAFSNLYDKYAPLLFGLLTKIIDNKKTAEDILQKVFFEVWENRNKYNFFTEPFFIFLAKKARKIALSYLGKQRKSDDIPAIHNAGNTVYNKEAEQGLIQKSNSNFKAGLELVYLKGYSFTEAALKLKIPVIVLKQNIILAIKNLKERFIK